MTLGSLDSNQDFSPFYDNTLPNLNEELQENIAWGLKNVRFEDLEDQK